MPTRDPVRCTFCDDMAVDLAIVHPPMCRRHYHIAAMMCVLERESTGVSLPAMRRLLAQVSETTPAEAVLVVTNELPQLVWDLLQNCERLF
jgi:hypothetical protein